jgi:hypothetical protein
MRLFRLRMGPHPPHPVNGLFSHFWRLAELPIKRLIIDECQEIKKANVKRFSGHPFDTRTKFMNAFTVATRNTRAIEYDEPDVVSLQRFLLAITVARPSNCLEMPGQLKMDATEALLPLRPRRF